MDYVRLKTMEDINRASPFSIGWKAWAVVAACLLVGAAVIITALAMRKSGRHGFVETHGDGVTIAGIFIIMGGLAFMLMAMISQSAVSSSQWVNDTVSANTAIIRQSYRVEDLQPSSGRKSMLASVLAPTTSESEKNGNGNTRLEVTAKNSSGHGVRRLILQVDQTNRLRVYEGVGDSQHLLTPASLPEEKG